MSNGKITEVTIKKLFGYEGNDYTVKLLPEEPVTFIYGFNGIGKTTFLRLLDAVMKYNFTVLDSILFESITVQFDTGSILTVRRTVVKGFEEISVGEMRAFSKDDTGFYFPIVYEWPEQEKLYFDSKWNDWLNSGETDLETTMASGPDKFSDFYKHSPLYYFRKRFNNMKIEDGGSHEVVYPTVFIYANKDYNREFEAVRQLDSDFSDLFRDSKEFDTIGYRLEEINEIVERKRQGCESKQDRYYYIPLPNKIDGLEKYLKEKALENRLFDEDDESARDAMLTSKEKDSSFFEMRCKIFTDVINKKSGLTDKFIRINERSGEIAVTVRYEEKDYPLDIKNLSSGEKNLLLLYAHIIFADLNVYSGKSLTLFLLDEPEVSMHPDWLMDFVDNLEYINKELKREKKCQFIIATHSIAITYDHNEMMTPMRRYKNV